MASARCPTATAALLHPSPPSPRAAQVKGKLLELSSHHTASRVIQFCVKCGGDEERRVVMEEVKANIVELSRSKYGHFLVRKLISAAKKDEVPGEWRQSRLGG